MLIRPGRVGRFQSFKKGDSVAGTFLPSVGTSPTGVMGLQKLISNYNGPAVRVVRMSDSVEMDVGFVGQAFDLASALTFQGASVLNVKTFYDQTGNGNHLIQTTTAQQPVLWLGDGGPVLKAALESTTRRMLIPNTLQADRQNTSIFMVARTPSEAVGVGMWEFGDLTNLYDLGLRSYSSHLNINPIYDSTIPNPVTDNFNTVNVANMSIMGLVSSPSKMTVHRDEQTIDFPAATSKSMVLGGQMGNTHTSAGRFDTVAFVFYPAALSDADTLSVKNALRDVTGSLLFTSTYGLCAQGDSITFGTGSSNNRTVTAAIQAYTGRTVPVRNIGIGGTTAAGRETFWDGSAGKFQVSGKPNYLRFHYGRNDIKLGSDSATTITAVKGCLTSARAVFTKVIVVTALPNVPADWTPTMETYRQELNAWIRSDPRDAGGVRYFDAIDDLAMDPILGDAATLAGQGAHDTTLFPDYLHPSEKSIKERMAPAWAASLLNVGQAVETPVVVGSPVVSSAPVITGTAQVDQTLTATCGGWSNIPGTGVFSIIPANYRYQWKAAGVAISGATFNTYKPVAGDVGKTLTCEVTASNSAASVVSASAATAAVTAASVAPINTVAPAVTGTTVVGNTLSATTGTWSNGPTGYTYQWYWADTNAAISGATASTYVLVSGDVGHTLKCVVTATNAAGSTTASSNTSTTVTAVVTGLLIDNLTAAPLAAYSLRKLRSGYTGACLKVRRSTDDATQDIGFGSDGGIDKTALIAFVTSSGANTSANGFVDTWYDQVGTNNWTQPTASVQPTIVSSGVVSMKGSLPALYMNSAYMLSNLTASPASNTRSVFNVSAHENSSNGDILTSPSTGGYSLRWGSSQFLQLLKIGTLIATGTVGSTVSVYNTHYCTFNGSAYAFGVNGANGGSGTSANTFTAGLTSRIGQITGGAQNQCEMIVFDGAIPNGTDMSTIQASQKAYWGTP